MRSPHKSSQLRTGRYSEKGRIYLVTTNTKDRQLLFKDWQVGKLVAQNFSREERDGVVESLAWVVMPDHFHWLIELKDNSLSLVVGRVKSLSCAAVNAALGRTGSLWQRSFHDRAVRSEDDLKAMARYIILNPVRAGLVKRVGDYPLWDAKWV